MGARGLVEASPAEVEELAVTALLVSSGKGGSSAGWSFGEFGGGEGGRDEGRDRRIAERTIGGGGRAFGAAAS